MRAEPLTAEQIDALPLYDWEVASVGDMAPPFSFLVTEESIAKYCAAVRNENPLYLNPETARRGPLGGIIAPGYIAAWSLILNLVVAVVLTPVFNAMGAAKPRDDIGTT